VPGLETIKQENNSSSNNNHIVSTMISPSTTNVDPLLPTSAKTVSGILTNMQVTKDKENFAKKFKASA